MFQVFLFCESAMIALWDGKQVETAFFSKYIQLCTKSSKLTRGGVFRLKNIVITPSSKSERRWDGSDQKGQKSKSGVLPAMGWRAKIIAKIAKIIATPGKIKATAAILQYYRGALTPQPDGKTYKRRLAQKVFGLQAKPMSLRPFNTKAFLICST